MKALAITGKRSIATHGIWNFRMVQILAYCRSRSLHYSSKWHGRPCRQLRWPEDPSVHWYPCQSVGITRHTWRHERSSDQNRRITKRFKWTNETLQVCFFSKVSIMDCIENYFQGCERFQKLLGRSVRRLHFHWLFDIDWGDWCQNGRYHCQNSSSTSLHVYYWLGW